MLLDPAKAPTRENWRVEVILYEGVKPMSFLYSDADIVRHCNEEARITFVPREGEVSVPWCSFFDWRSKSKQFFFDDDFHDGIESTIAQHTEQRTRCHGSMKL